MIVGMVYPFLYIMKESMSSNSVYPLVQPSGGRLEEDVFSHRRPLPSASTAVIWEPGTASGAFGSLMLCEKPDLVKEDSLLLSTERERQRSAGVQLFEMELDDSPSQEPSEQSKEPAVAWSSKRKHISSPVEHTLTGSSSDPIKAAVRPDSGKPGVLEAKALMLSKSLPLVEASAMEEASPTTAVTARPWYKRQGSLNVGADSGLMQKPRADTCRLCGQQVRCNDTRVTCC